MRRNVVIKIKDESGKVKFTVNDEDTEPTPVPAPEVLPADKPQEEEEKK